MCFISHSNPRRGLESRRLVDTYMFSSGSLQATYKAWVPVEIMGLGQLDEYKQLF